ncbi:DUF4058 family protein [Oscillatoria sp. CS-180]|uniref:DUF4058 family protein n=1 Tax=Oscillatoria sp. CS-180 TaxID=3021720 RepID=UPI00232C8421|nr:DUF4058 family protein [Oscillatoria sp. CS-180]MDB9526164.1 DUF4058 family protein [Oscillatoria sp. CS-180]
MPSPLPGMDPYLEQPAFWSSFHSRFIVALADAIETQLAPDYYIEVEARTYLDNAIEGALMGIPDAVIVSNAQKETLLQPSDVGVLAVQVEPQQVEVPIPEEVTERYLEIRDLTSGAVITAIELLSPKNKRSEKGRMTYTEKRTQILGSATSLVELDLLRAGYPMPLSSNVMPTPYRILVSPSYQRPKADLYGFGLRQPLPTITIPLKPEDDAIAIALQPIFEGVYERGRYQTRIDYTQMPPAPSLSEADQVWLKEHLHNV